MQPLLQGVQFPGQIAEPHVQAQPGQYYLCVRVHVRTLIALTGVGTVSVQ